MDPFIFYPLDATYRMESSGASILLFGRSASGEQVCIVDDQFAPYFYAIVPKGKNRDKLQEEITAVRVKEEENEYTVRGVTAVQKNYQGVDIEVLRVVLHNPKGVPAVSSFLSKEMGVKTFETDILYTRRFLVDKGIVPLMPYEVEGTHTPYSLRVPCISATSIKPAGDEAFKHPNLLSFDIETYSPTRSIAPEQYPILMISFYGMDNGKQFKKVITWKHFKTEHEYIEFVNSEADLLQRFKEVVEKHKPDMLVGYYSDGFDLPYIMTRAKKYDIKLDLGLDFSEMKASRGGNGVSITGIVHLDILSFLRNVMRTTLKTDSYDLDSVAQELLGEHKKEVDLAKLHEAWDHQHEKLEEYCVYNLHDAVLTYNLAEKVFPNITELVKVVGLAPFDVIRMRFSQLVEWFLISQTKEFNELIPNKPAKEEVEERRKHSFKGAFVFEPTPGIYYDIMVFDFRSLYPSIITSHNIGPSTLGCSCCHAHKAPSTKYHFCTKKRGFIPSVVDSLISRRMRIKEILKEHSSPTLEARSEALKTLANSTYGYYAFFGARWYCLECAQSVTAWGRHYIHEVINDAGKHGFTVLYSDTDSIFLLLGTKKQEDALRFVEGINKKLPGVMELSFEEYYPSGIFVPTKDSDSGAKKKYALYSRTGKLKIRGFEAVRRNWSVIGKEVQEEVLLTVLKYHEPKRAFAYVKQIVHDLRDHKIPNEKVVATTQLQKEISHYDAVGPHVAVATRMREKGLPVGPGSIIPFIIVEGSGRLRDKARIPDEVDEGKYDAEYYISNQVVPAVESIFKVLGISKEELEENKDQSKLADWFS